MSNFSGTRGRRLETQGVFTTTTEAVSVVAAGTSSTEGAWVTLGQFSYPLSGFILHVATGDAGRATVPATTYDIALGDGSTTIVESMYMGDVGNRPLAQRSLFFPLRVPASVNVLARIRTETTVNVNAIFSMTGHAATYGFTGFTKVEAINVSASSAATTVDPGAVANTKGAAVSLTTGGLPRDYKGFYVYAQHNVANAGGAFLAYLVDLMSGTAVLANDIHVAITTTEDASYSAVGPIWLPVAAATPMSARCQSTSNASPTRLIEVALYGIY